jgi:hypothetical protein
MPILVMVVRAGCRFFARAIPPSEKFPTIGPRDGKSTPHRAEVTGVLCACWLKNGHATIIGNCGS